MAKTNNYKTNKRYNVFYKNSMLLILIDTTIEYQTVRSFFKEA